MGGGRINDDNIDEISAAARLARALGCDYFELKPEYDAGHYLLPLHAQAPRIREQMDLIRPLETRAFSVVAPPTLAEALEGRDQQPKSYHACPVASLRTVLSPSGAYICAYHRGSSYAKYGDIAATNFTKLWGSESHRQVLRQIDPSVHCPFHCIRHDSNLVLLGEAPLPRDTIADPFI